MKHNNSSNIDYGKRAPPASLFPLDSPDEAELEGQFQQAMQDEDNRQRFEDFVDYNPDGPSTSEIEAAEKYFRESPEEQQHLENFINDFNKSEEIQRENPFWRLLRVTEVPSFSQPTQQAPPTAPATVNIRSTTPSSTQLPMPPLDIGKSSSKRPDIYSVTNWLVRNAHLALLDGILYFYNNGAYLPKRAAEAKRLLTALCRPVIEATGNPQLVQQVFNALLMEPRICKDFEEPCNIVAFDDVLLDLDNMQILPHSPSVFVTTRLKASYNIGLHQDCPVFKKLLYEISRGDQELEGRIWESLGYLLAPSQAGKSFILFQGVPNSGKSLLGNFLRRCFDGDVVSALEINELQGKFVLSDLVGKKLCVDFDLPAAPFSEKAVSKLKKLTGADAISSDVKFDDRVRFLNTAKFLFATNHRVILHGDDDAFFDRLVVIPFAVAVDKANQDFHLPEKLDRERSAIIVQALRYYQALVRNNFIFSGDFQINEAVAANSGHSTIDNIAAFLQDSCEQVKDAWVSTNTLYAAFVAKYGAGCSKNTFSRLLLQICQSSRINIQKHRHRIITGGNPIYGFLGLKLKEDKNNYG